MPGPGYKSVTVSEENHRKAKEMADAENASISSIYENCVDAKYRRWRLVESGAEMEASRLSVSSPAMRSTEIGLEGIRTDMEAFKSNVAEKKTEIEFRQADLGSDPDNPEKKAKLARAQMDLGKLYMDNSLPVEAEKKFAEAQDLLESIPEEELTELHRGDIREAESLIEEARSSEMGRKVQPYLELVLTLSIPGRDPLIISKLDMGDASNLVKAAAELIQIR